ncbi:hypothetical protein [Actinocrispum wychmicini]|uniref:Type VII secretion system (Wss) protein ESAT-6 n=1 Tax=Actinocrispum wychmicini TaxID=1213861 RepID=A0A4R2JDR9_9PSEU|nr:hypothetical protein [Actinocrispum wychmicini]TCO57084.1 hypothetical protein EV192_106561 [Actinocrispum wychmicini]
MSAEAAQQTADAVNRIRNTWNDIQSGVNSVLDWLPGFLCDKLKEWFNKLANKVGEFFEAVAKPFTQRGSADALRIAGQSWNTDIGGRASTQAGLLAPEQLKTDNEWQGKAADSYKDSITGQGKALASVKTQAESVQNVLNEIANALDSFWNGLLAAVLIYVGAMVLCAIGAATVVAAIPSIIAAVTASIAVIAQTVNLTTTFVNALQTQRAKLEQVATTDSAFANGQWPPATTGDNGGWKPKE